MALTRISRSVVASNLINSSLLANNSVEGRHIADGTITAAQLDAGANAAAVEVRINANVDIVQDNVAAVETRRSANNTLLTTEDAAIETRRAANIAGAVSTITTADLTASRALIAGTGGKVEVSAVTSTELGHLDGVTSAVQTQIDAIETRRAANVTSATFTDQVNMNDDLVITGNLTVNGTTTTVDTTDLTVADRMIMLASGATGSPTLDVGFLFNRGNQGNAAIFYDESTTTFKLSDTKDPLSNTALSPVTQSNLDVGILTAASVKFDGADLSTAITDNRSGAISTVFNTNLTASRALIAGSGGKIEVSDVTSTELGHLDGVTSALQTQIDSKIATTDSASNDFVTYTRLNANLNSTTANINIVQDNVDAVETTLATKIAITDSASNDFITFTRLNSNLNSTTANINVVQDNVAAISGGATLLSPHTNVITSIADSNTYGVGLSLTAIANVLSVTIDGVTQAPTTDFIYNNPGDTIQFKDIQTTFPAGLTITIVGLRTAS